MPHPNKTGSIAGISYSPDGKRLIAGGYPGGTVVVWDIPTGKRLSTIETGHTYRGNSQIFVVSPDWKTLYASWPGKIKTKTVEHDGKQLTRWEFDGLVRAWDLLTGKLQKIYKHDTPRFIYDMEFSPNGTQFITSEKVPGTYERDAKPARTLWDVTSGRNRPLPDNVKSFGTLSPDGKILANTIVDPKGHTTALKLFDQATGKEKLSIPIKEKNTEVSIWKYSPNGNLILGSYRVLKGADEPKNKQSWLKLWDAATGHEVASLEEQKDYYSSTHFSADGKTLTVACWKLWAGSEVSLFHYSIADRKKSPFKTLILAEQPKAKGERLWATAPIYSPDGRWLALSTQVYPPSEGNDPDACDLPQPRIHLIDVPAGQLRQTLVGPQGFAQSPCFSPDGRTLASSGHGCVLLWDMTNVNGGK